MTSADKKYCVGCREDYYNHDNNSTTGECWNFKSAKVVTKFCIGWWTSMDKKTNFQKVTTHSCHIETGKRLFVSQLPEHLREKPPFQMQINNLKVKYIKTEDKWQVISPDKRILEEFRERQDAIKCAKSIVDFVKIGGRVTQ